METNWKILPRLRGGVKNLKTKNEFDFYYYYDIPYSNSIGYKKNEFGICSARWDKDII